MARRHIMESTFRLNLLNPQHAKINEVIKGLNPKIYKSKNQFLIEACEFYIDHYGQFYHEPNASLVIYTGAERGSEEGTCGRSSEGNDSYLLLSGGYCGEDEFISKEARNLRNPRLIFMI